MFKKEGVKIRSALVLSFLSMFLYVCVLCCVVFVLVLVVSLVSPKSVRQHPRNTLAESASLWYVQILPSGTGDCCGGVLAAPPHCCIPHILLLLSVVVAAVVPRWSSRDRPRTSGPTTTVPGIFCGLRGLSYIDERGSCCSKQSC